MIYKNREDKSRFKKENSIKIIREDIILFIIKFFIFYKNYKILYFKLKI
jgi:hypothetical protein